MIERPSSAVEPHGFSAFEDATDLLQPLPEARKQWGFTPSCMGGPFELRFAVGAARGARLRPECRSTTAQ
jgi:hypothetical protein